MLKGAKEREAEKMHEQFEHKADMGVRGIGKSREEAFAECAKAMFEVMIELESVKALREVKVEVDGNDLEGLLVEWLNELLYLKDHKEMFFSEFEVESIGEEVGKFVLRGAVRGDKIDLENQRVKVEVKAATYSGLKVEKIDGHWSAECIVDV